MGVTLRLTMVTALTVAITLPLQAQRMVNPGRIIDLHINAESRNVSLDGSVVEGGRFQLTFDDQVTYAISPVQSDDSGDRFLVTLLRGNGPQDSLTFTPIEAVPATLGRPVPFKSLPLVTVVIDGVRGARATSGSGFVSFVGRVGAFQDTCCVKCGGIGACGCKVSGTCGFCCINPCCPEPVSNDRFLPAPRPLFTSSETRCKSVPDSERLFTGPGGRPRPEIAAR